MALTKKISSNCVSIANRLIPEDQDAVLKRLDELVATGITPAAAQLVAAQDTLAALQAERDAFMSDLRAQHPDLFTPTRRTAGQAAASAAKNTAEGLNNALDGLTQLFGGGGRLGSGPTFDEETYAKAKPLFMQAIANLKDAAADIREAMREIIRMMLDRVGREVTERMRPYVVKFIGDVRSGQVKLETGNVSATGTDPQRTGQDGQTQAQGNRNAVPNEPGRTGQVSGRAGEGTGTGGTRSQGGERVSGTGTSAAGERGNQSVRREDGRFVAENDPARDSEQERGGGDSGQRTDADTRAADVPVQVAPLAERLKQQKAAEGIEVKFGDPQNIRETLPLLMPSQHEDVLFAENRLTKPDGFGVLFTNGTGTGKTFLGLGIIKRMHKAGKRNGLIVVPNDAVMNEWMRSAKDIGLTITALESTSDKGNGIAITTYANLANNLTLADRDIDFFVADEAHSLMSNAQAEVTGGLKTARAITLHPDSAIDRTNLIERDAVARLATLKSEIEVLGRLANRDDTMDEMRRDYQKQIADMEKESGELQKKWDRTLDAQKELIASRQNDTRPRSIFLSATPFAYEKNTDWANAYLYSYGRDNPNRGYNEPGPRESFMVRHFGYTMRYNKLTEPDASVDRGLMQRQFNTWMRKQGVLSARMLNVEQDYDRKFVLIDGGIGTRIDQALKWLREADGGKYYPFYSAANERFDYLSRSRLLEAIKAKAAIPYIKAQHALGRKVVVFYDYNQGGGFNAFDFGLNRDADIEVNVIDPDTKAFKTITYKKGEFIDAFNREFPDLIGAAFERATSPLDTLTEAFPTAGVYNGIVQKSTRQSTIDNFNNDDMPEANLLIVQSSANAGWSGHDRSGKFPRVLINLGLPVAPTKAIQQEGRIYRVGQASNAIFRYFNTGTLWEKYAFATKVARRASTAENLAMGEDARGLLDSFLDAFENSSEYPPSQNEGTGGKAIDRDAKALLSDFDRAKTFYYARLKKNSSNKSQEGVDFFPTPEPIGLKMVEWLHARPNDDLLEPSAGDGAIARWFPDTTNRTVVEPSFELGSRLALVTDAKMVTEPFEQLNIVNKYDGIAMNPPFGVGGRTAMEHVAKAFNHLKERGRLIALIPEGPMMDRRLDEWLNMKDARGRIVLPEARLIASISLPTTVFGRAGTAVKTRIVIIDKVSDKNIVSTAVNYDLSKSDDINETFDLVNALDFARVQNAVAQVPAQSTPAAPAGRVVDNLDDATFEVKDGKLVTDAPEVTYKTQAGKILKGVYVPFPTLAKEVDAYTFRAKGMPGNFVRLQHVVRPTLDVSVEPDSTGGNFLSLARPAADDKKNSVSEARISPRRPTAVKATEDPLAPERLQPDLASAKLLGKGFTRNINLMAAYPNFVGIKGTAEQKAEQMIEQMVDNLVWLHNHWRDEYRGRTKLWYLGGNRIAARWSERFGASIQSVVSAIAMTSPQKDWFQNVSIAERILEALTNNADVPFDAKMRAAAMSRAWGKGKAKILRKIDGKTLRDLYDKNDDASLIDMAVWIRAWDEANNPQMARVITPEGAFKNDWDRGKTGKPVGFRWQSFPTIARTIKALATDDRAAISEIIGSNHKVRSFFNNLVAPLFGEDVTIDTHAVAAALLRPLGSASIEVKHNFGSGNAPRKDADGNVITKGIPGTTNSSVLGLYGTYAIYAEAYRRAAQRVGVLPREMQSITWEAVRGLFRPEQKNEKIKRQVDAIWKRVAKGELNVSEARERISGLVEGIRDPAWAGSDAGMDEAGRDSSYQSRVSQGSGSAGATVGRAGDGVAGAVQEPAGLASPAVAFSQLPESVRADALTKLKGLERKLEQGKITEAEYRLGVQQVIGALERRNEVQQARREEADLRRGADWIVSQLRRGLADEKIPRKAVDFAQWLLQQNPQLADGLAISVVAPKSKDAQVAGDYNPALQVMRLIIGQSDDDTAVHEILHHTERMMPAEVRQGVTKAWQRAWDAAYRAGDTDTRIALTNMLKASMGNSEARQRTLQAFRDGLLNMDAHYQLYSASEFWAVNGTRILSGRFEADKSWVKRAIQWFKEFIERVKDVFGLPSDAAVLKGLNAVMAGDGQFVTNKMLSQAASYNAITPQGPIGQSPTPPPVPTAAQNAMAMTGGQNQPAWNVDPAGLMDKFIYEVQDRQINLKRVQEAISTVSNIREQFDAYTKEELYHGRVAARTDKFLSKELQPLLEDMKARKVSLDQIESYLWARHAKERNTQVAKINPAFPDGGSGLTNAQVDDYFNGIDVVDANGDVIIAGMDPAQARHLDALARRVDAINAGTKQILIQYGLESPDTIMAWNGTYKNYVPLFREDMEGSMPIGQGFSVKGSSSRRALGSKRAVVDIIANLALQRETALTRGEKNRVGMSLYALAKSNPNADIWEVGKVPMKRVIDPRTGLVTAVPDPGYKNQDNVLVVRMRGKDVAIIFNQRNERAMQMALTLKNLDIAAFGAVMGAVSTGTRYFASINTQYNPIFGILNIIRDSFAAPLNLTTTALANKKFAVMRQVPLAIRAIWKIERNGSSGTPYDALYEQMKMSGGTTGYREMFRVGKDRADKLQKEINAMNASAPRKAFNWLLDWLDDYNTALENAVRLSAFRVGVASGISPDKSASISKNITVNFNRKGRVGRELGAWYAFFNAAVQGTTRTIQTLRGPAGAKIIMGGVALGVMQTLVAMMAFDDDEWEDIPDFIKQRNFIIPAGGSAYITVPYPLGFNVLPNIGRIASEWIRQGGKNPGKHAVDLLMSVLEASNPFGSGTLSQVISPTLADPIVALAENKDFTGRPIAKTDLVSTDPTPGFMRARDTSSTVSRFLSERLNALTGGTKYTPGMFTPTPDQIDYVFGTLTGGIGRELNRAYQSVEMTMQGKDVPEHRKPLWGRFYGTTDEDSAVSSRYWRNVRELNTLEREYNGRLKDREEVNSLIKSNPEVTWAKSLNANERQIGRMRVERTRIEFDQKLTETDRTTKLDAQDKLIVDAMRRYNDQVRLAKGKKPLPPPDDSSD